ncbi:MAG: radical SAM protein [Thermoprotei archaeon]
MPRYRVLFTRVKQALTRSGLPDLDYALNPYIGCIHGCLYCYARLYTWHSEARNNWGSVVIIKENLLEVLDKETKRYPRGVVGVSTITDPYQPVEAIYRLTRKSLKLLLERSFNISIQTKNTLVLRDLDILLEHKDKVDVGFTITGFNEKIRILEPYSSPPKTRVKTLEILSRKGIETWIFYGPIIPGINTDEDTIKQILDIARRTKSKVLIDKLHIKPFMLENTSPMKHYALLAKKFSWKKFYEKIQAYCREYSVTCIEGLAEPTNAKQLKLDVFTRRQ